MKMTGNTIFITGGTSGIGRSLAERFHALGNRVIVAGRRRALLDELVASHTGIEAIELDVEDDASIRAAVSRIETEFPNLNVLFNNAGIMKAERLLPQDADGSIWRSTIQTNVVSVLGLTEALLPTLLKNQNAAIVTTTSGLAFVPRGGFPAYCASKAFLHSWVQSLRYQLRATGVEVLELAPPYVQTELTGGHQAIDPAALPLVAFVNEVMALLEDGQTPDGEILVERVKPLRFAERAGTYAERYVALNPV